MKEFVLAERAELDAKLSDLIPFLKTAMFKSLPIAEQRRLFRQCNAMKTYSKLLGDRVEADFQ